MSTGMPSPEIGNTRKPESQSERCVTSHEMMEDSGFGTTLPPRKCCGDTGTTHRDFGGFALGRIVATPGALDALEQAVVSPTELVGRHLSGDWGNVDEADWQANDRALLEGARLLSAYALPVTGERIWVITEWDRSLTTLLRPDEY